MQAGLTNPLPHRPAVGAHPHPQQPLLCTSCMQLACVRQGNSGEPFAVQLRQATAVSSMIPWAAE